MRNEFRTVVAANVARLAFLPNDFLHESNQAGWGSLHKELFESCKKDFENITEFIQTVDCLFALSKVKLNKVTGEIELC